jgi:hypothetical protein
MTHPLNRQSISPTDAAAVVAKPPAMGVLDPHRRTLFTQRLAVLIQRLRAVSATLAREDVPDED